MQSNQQRPITSTQDKRRRTRLKKLTTKDGPLNTFRVESLLNDKQQQKLKQKIGEGGGESASTNHTLPLDGVVLPTGLNNHIAVSVMTWNILADCTYASPSTSTSSL